jgi:hypothetical protein
LVNSVAGGRLGISQLMLAVASGDFFDDHSLAATAIVPSRVLAMAEFQCRTPASSLARLCLIASPGATEDGKRYTGGLGMEGQCGAQSAKGAPASGMHSRLISGLPPASEQQPENENQNNQSANPPANHGSAVIETAATAKEKQQN